MHDSDFVDFGMSKFSDCFFREDVFYLEYLILRNANNQFVGKKETRFIQCNYVLNNITMRTYMFSRSSCRVGFTYNCVMLIDDVFSQCEVYLV